MVRNCVENFELKKACWMGGRKEGWMDGWESRVKDCLQQSKILQFVCIRERFQQK